MAFWAPPRIRSGGDVLPDTGGRFQDVAPFYWTPREFIDDGLLRFLFTDASDVRNQIPFIEERVRAQLRKWAVDVAGQPGAVVLRSPPPGGHARGEATRPRPDEVVVHDLATLAQALERWLDPPDGEPDRAWTGRVQAGTVSAFMRRLFAAIGRLGALVRAGKSRRIDRDKAQVTVVAIQKLHDLAQRFVVGALLQETFEDKERTGQRLPLSVIVLDELNKYAPREGTSPLKEMLIDIAQRRAIPRGAPGRCSADSVAGGTRGHGERLDQSRRPARRRGSRAGRIWLDAAFDPSTSEAAQARDDGAQPALDPGAPGALVSFSTLGHPKGGSRRAG